MYTAPKGRISKFYYRELDNSFQSQINEIETIAEQIYYTKENKAIYIREYTLNKLWNAYCIREKTNNPDYHNHKKATLGKTIEQLRLASNYTQQDICNVLNISIQELDSWEKGLVMPSLQTIQQMSKFFMHPLDTYIKNSYYI